MRKNTNVTYDKNTSYALDQYLTYAKYYSDTKISTCYNDASVATWNMSLELQSQNIASRYGFVPIEHTQESLLDYLKQSDNCLIGNIPTIAEHYKDERDSYISAMSVASYINKHNPVAKTLLLNHSVGTGKSRKAMLAAIGYNRDVTIIGMHGPQKYVFDRELELTSALMRMFPGFNKRVDFVTCKKVVMTAGLNNSSDFFDYYFKNRFIIIDEVHRIRTKEDMRMRDAKQFDCMVDILCCYPDSVILLLTATPLVDVIGEIYGLRKICKRGESEEGNSMYIASMFKGYVSSLIKSNLKTRTHETSCRMLPDGDQWYQFQLFKDDTDFIKLRPSSISRFIIAGDMQLHYKDWASDHPAFFKDIVASYIGHAPIDAAFNSDYKLAFMEVLKRIAVKYYTLISIIESKPTQLHFIYDFWKKNGGAVRLVEILTTPVMGYTSVHRKTDVTQGSKNLLALHELLIGSNNSTVREMLDICNSRSNADGSRIRIVLATPKFSESMSLSNISNCHQIHRAWNITHEQQVEGRINRKTSLRYIEGERVIDSYYYMLEEPDGTRTYEHDRRDRSIQKYDDIKPALRVLHDDKVENCYIDKDVPIYKRPQLHISSRINNRIRMSRHEISHRLLEYDISHFLNGLEQFSNFFTYMDYLSSLGSGRNKSTSIAIYAIEQIYIKIRKHEQVTTAQYNMIIEMKNAFVVVEHEGVIHTLHVMHFTNADTTEYQRLANVRDRVARWYDPTNHQWLDIINEDTTREINRMYDHITQNFCNANKGLWKRYGFYVTRFTLLPCYRLVEYKEKSNVAKTHNAEEVDQRKPSRGKRYEYGNRETLVKLYTTIFDDTTTGGYEFVSRSNLRNEEIFLRCKQALESIGLQLNLPV